MSWSYVNQKSKKEKKLQILQKNVNKCPGHTSIKIQKKKKVANLTKIFKEMSWSYVKKNGFMTMKHIQTLLPPFSIAFNMKK